MTDDVEQRLDRLESVVTDQQESIEDQQETIRQQRERIAQLEAETETDLPVRRRTALQAGGLLALLGVAGGTASADPQGQVGTSSDPLRTLFTTELDGPVTGGTALTDIAGPGLSIKSGRLTGTGVSDDGTSVAAGVTDIDFGAGLGVVNDGDGTVTVGSAPTITGFAMTNPSGADLKVSFDASRQLATIAVEITDSGGNTVTTLTEGDFTESCATSSCTYTGIHKVATTDTYTATLTTAEDEPGFDGATGQSDTATVDLIAVAFLDGSDSTPRRLNLDGTVEDYATSITAAALGPPTTDLTGDGTPDLPIKDGNSNLVVVDIDGNTSTLDSSGRVSSNMGVGDWNGDGTVEVVYVRTNSGNKELYSVAPGRSPTNLGFTPTTAPAVADFDGDGSQEIIWGNDDGSNKSLVYSSDGATTQDTGYDVSRDLGRPADFDDDGTIEIPDVGGDIVLVEADGSTTTRSTSSSVRSASTGPLDYTDTGVPDVIYVEGFQKNIYYYDVVNDTTGPVTDASGNTLQAELQGIR